MAQKEFWVKEYRKKIPDLTGSKKPSHSISFFLDYLTKEKIPLGGKVLELGFGRGRNIIFLARKGFEMWGLDFVGSVHKLVKQKIKGKPFSKSIHLVKHDITKKYPFENEFFDYVLDILASGTLSERERRNLRREVARVLKPGGYFLLYVPNRSHPDIARLIIRKKHGIFIHPESGLYEKAYFERGLRKLFPRLKLVKSGVISFSDRLYGKRRCLSYLCGIFHRN